MPRARPGSEAEVIAELTRCLAHVLAERRPPRKATEYLVTLPIERHRALVKLESAQAMKLAQDAGLL